MSWLTPLLAGWLPCPRGRLAVLWPASLPGCHCLLAGWFAAGLSGCWLFAWGLLLVGQVDGSPRDGTYDVAAVSSRAGLPVGRF